MTPRRLSTATATELAALSALCHRSKAHWGYDAAFIQACRDELTLTAKDLQDPLAVTRDNGRFTGLVQLDLSDTGAELDRMFVDPADIGKGYGRVLFNWATDHAAASGANYLRIVSDPNAQPFYEAMGAIQAGTTPSGSIPGRYLPVLHLAL